MELKKFDPSEFPSNYHDYKLLGKGGFGEVRACYHASLGRVALKLFRITGGRKDIKRAKRGLEKEAKILQRMKHPHIVTFYGVTSLFEKECLVMEFMEGGNLNELLMSKIVLSWTGRLRLLHELISAISYLHNHDRKRAFIHGDIKPQNILLTKSRSLKLADFGSVNISERTGVSTTTFEIPHSTQHTWPYTAPERLNDPDLKKTATMDIYSYGITAYEVLTRIKAYSSGARHAIIHDGKRPNQSKLDEVDKQLKQHQKQDHEIFLKLQFLMKDCWQQDPTKRPKATEIWRSTAQQMNEFSVKEESDVETTKHSDESSDTDSEDMEVSAMDDSGNASNYRSHAIGSDVVISVGVDTDRLNSLVGSSDAEALNHELPAMEGLDMETLTDELTTTDGFSIDMEVSSVEDSDGNTITPQVDELPEAACLIVGGSNKVKKIVETYDVNKKSFKPRKSTLYERWGSTSVKINNHVYTAGDVGSNFVECLNLNQVDGDWYEVASMKEQRCGAASAVLNDQMCVTGGCGGSNILSSVDLYNPVVNTWTNIAPMKTERCEHALVSYNGRLFAFGGVIGNPIGLESMESYDPREGKWKSLKPMNKKRSALCGVVYNDEIYAIGGIGLKSVERYNIRTNTWTNVSSLNHVRDRSCACVVNGKIYVIGGNGVDASRSIEAYDGTINEWKIETNMETSRHNASVVAL